MHPLLDLGLSGNYHVLLEPLLLLISDLLSLAFHVFLGILIPDVNLSVSLALFLYVVPSLEHKEDRIFDFPKLGDRILHHKQLGCRFLLKGILRWVRLNWCLLGVGNVGKGAS